MADPFEIEEFLKIYTPKSPSEYMIMTDFDEIEMKFLGLSKPMNNKDKFALFKRYKTLMETFQSFGNENMVYFISKAFAYVVKTISTKVLYKAVNHWKKYYVWNVCEDDNNDYDHDHYYTIRMEFITLYINYTENLSYNNQTDTESVSEEV